MRIEHGYGVMTDLLTGKVIEEHSYFSCAHCSRKVPTKTLRSHDYSTCFNCDDGKGRGLICQRPECRECTPFFKALEADEARAKFRSML
jgi:hypothetical protein